MLAIQTHTISRLSWNYNNNNNNYYYYYYYYYYSAVARVHTLIYFNLPVLLSVEPASKKSSRRLRSTDSRCYSTPRLRTKGGDSRVVASRISKQEGPGSIPGGGKEV